MGGSLTSTSVGARGGRLCVVGVAQEEVKLYIFSFLSPVQLVRLSRVSKAFYRLTNDSQVRACALWLRDSGHAPPRSCMVRVCLWFQLRRERAAEDVGVRVCVFAFWTLDLAQPVSAAVHGAECGALQ